MVFVSFTACFEDVARRCQRRRRVTQFSSRFPPKWLQRPRDGSSVPRTRESRVRVLIATGVAKCASTNAPTARAIARNYCHRVPTDNRETICICNFLTSPAVKSNRGPATGNHRCKQQQLRCAVGKYRFVYLAAQRTVCACAPTMAR